MRDIEFVAELFVLSIDGVQDGQKTLDKFYAENDLEFPDRSAHRSHFLDVLTQIRPLSSMIKSSRFKKRADFYGLFAAVNHMVKKSEPSPNVARAKRALKRLARELEQSADNLTGVSQRYYNTVIEGPNKLSKRKERRKILLDLLRSTRR